MRRTRLAASMYLALGLLVGRGCSDDAAHDEPRPIGVERVPNAWYEAGSNPEAFKVMLVDEPEAGRNTCAMLVRDTTVELTESWSFGTLMQTISAKRYRGRNVRLSGWMKATEGVEWGAFWMRVDGESYSPLAFDNMGDRKVSGSTPWKQYSIVLPVTDSAATIAFGFLMIGYGAVMVDDIEFAVSNDAPTTDMHVEPTLLPLEDRGSIEGFNEEPGNLSFDY